MPKPKIDTKELQAMSDQELAIFFCWFFGNDRAYMIEHILEHSEDLKEELSRFKDQGSKI